MISQSRAAWITLVAILAVMVILLDPFGNGGSISDMPNGATAGTADESAVNLESAELFAAKAQAEGGVEEERTARDQDGLAVLEIVDENAVPLAGATVLLLEMGEIVAKQTCDESGRTAFPADDREFGMVIWRSNRVPHQQRITLAEGKQQVMMPPSLKVAGRLQMSDGTAASDLSLRLSASAAAFAFGDLPPSVISELGIYISYPLLVTRSDANGRFEFAGLQAAWEGSMRLPRDMEVVSASAGEVASAGQRVELAQPIGDLQMTLARSSFLHGRVVTREQQQPLAHVSLTAEVAVSGGGQPYFHGLQTDATGAFRIQAKAEVVDALKLHLGSAIGPSKAILDLDKPRIPVDGDLGVIEVPGLRRLEFLLRDEVDQAIAGGSAEGGGIKSKATDASGRSVFPWLPDSVSELRFLAPGFVPQVVSLQAPLPTPLVVYMERGNRLEITLRPPTGIDVSQFRIKLSAEQPLIAGPARRRQELNDYLQYPIVASSHMHQAPLGHVLVAETDSTGVAWFQALSSTLSPQLEVLGITGNTVYHSQQIAPLGKTEHRKMEVDLAAAGRHFHGRVMDPQGNAIHLATVQMGGEILAWTDPEGNFSCLVKDTEPRTLVLSASSFATRFIKNYQIPADESAVELTLEVALSVMIEVVDERGNPMPSADVTILRHGFNSNTHDRGNGRFEAAGLSSEKVVIRARVAGRDYLQDLLPAHGEAKIVVPLHGSIDVQLTPSAAAREGTYQILLIAEVDGESVVLNPSIAATTPDDVHLPLVLPATYQARLRYKPSPAELQAGMVEDWASDTSHIEVRAGETVVLKLIAN